MIQQATVKFLIFDLGGVLIDVDVSHTVAALSVLSGRTPQDITASYKKYPDFSAYERGELSDDEFRKFIKRAFSFEADDSLLDKAWNAMISDFPLSSFSLLEKLKSDYTLAVLSNTNQIHLDFINGQFVQQKTKQHSLNEFFHKQYYSYQVRKRKPEPEIFLQVLEENDFDPAEMLFFDDRVENIEAAAALGIQTFLVGHPNHVLDYFKKL